MWGHVGHTGTVTGQCSMCWYITGTRALAWDRGRQKCFKTCRRYSIAIRFWCRLWVAGSQEKRALDLNCGDKSKSYARLETFKTPNLISFDGTFIRIFPWNTRQWASTWPSMGRASDTLGRISVTMVLNTVRASSTVTPETQRQQNITDWGGRNWQLVFGTKVYVQAKSNT